MHYGKLEIKFWILYFIFTTFIITGIVVLYFVYSIISIVIYNCNFQLKLVLFINFLVKNINIYEYIENSTILSFTDLVYIVFL